MVKVEVDCYTEIFGRILVEKRQISQQEVKYPVFENLQKLGLLLRSVCTCTTGTPLQNNLTTSHSTIRHVQFTDESESLEMFMVLRITKFSLLLLQSNFNGANNLWDHGKYALDTDSSSR